MLGAAALTALGGTTALAAPSSSKSSSLSAAEVKSLKSSRNLWGTIDVCNPKDQPNAVGVRGSMPGDHQAGDKMYMRFTLQYLDAKTKRWTAVSKGVAAHYVPVGSAGAGRQDGRVFEFEAMPVAFTLRGVIDFQWRRAKQVLLSASRFTSAAHVSRQGSDPAGYSAAECVIG
jgi:hypothetical protein